MLLGSRVLCSLVLKWKLSILRADHLCFRVTQDIADTDLGAGECLFICPGNTDRPLQAARPVTLTPRQFFDAILSGHLVPSSQQRSPESELSEVRELVRWPWEITAASRGEVNEEAAGMPLDPVTATNLLQALGHRASSSTEMPGQSKLSDDEADRRMTFFAEQVVGFLYDAGYQIVRWGGVTQDADRDLDVLPLRRSG